MTSYDLVDEAMIDAPPAAVWDALVTEFQGAARWWVPHNTFSRIASEPDQLGGEVEVTVHTRGVDRGGLKLRFIARTTSVDPGRKMTVDYVRGVFRGAGEFSLHPLDGGHRTRIAMRFRARPHGWLRVLAAVVDLGAEHSNATRSAFVALNDHLGKKSMAGGGL